MSSYPDASVIVSAYSDEVGTAVARAWLRSAQDDGLLISDWSETEIASALALKVRTGVLASTDRSRVWDAVRDMIDVTAMRIGVDRHHFRAATRLLQRSERPLRGGDALHLAIAADAGATLCTLDRRMAEAGQALGLDVRLLR